MFSTCLEIKIESNSLDALKMTLTLWIPLFMKQTTQIKSVNTYSNERLSWNLNEKVTKYKIITFGQGPRKLIHENISLKVYLFNANDSKDITCHFASFLSMLVFQINLLYNNRVVWQRDDYNLWQSEFITFNFKLDLKWKVEGLTVLYVS